MRSRTVPASGQFPPRLDENAGRALTSLQFQGGARSSAGRREHLRAPTSVLAAHSDRRSRLLCGERGAPTGIRMNRHPQYRAFGTFRLILAVMVVAQHVVWIAPTGLSEILRCAATGNIAVLTFFALSGFIMAEAADQFYGGRPWAFSA